MSAGGTAQVADLTLHPYILQAIIQLEQVADVAGKIGDADRFGLGEEARLHAEIVVGIFAEGKWGS